MLRKLPDYLVGNDYSAAFLQRHCAVNDPSGKILDLYIAMSEYTISWAELKKVTPYKKNLEDSWIFDKFLDGPSLETDTFSGEGAEISRPAAGDIVPSWPPPLKRSASEITRSVSFGSSPDAEVSRAKIRRQCTGSEVELIGRHAEAV